jgi:hypothetical protein
MCITAFDSIIVYIVNIISNILLYNYGGSIDTKITSIFLLFVGQMQLFDYIFWKTDKYSIVNKISTKLSIIFNHLQPILLYILQKYYGLKTNRVSTLLYYIYIYAAILYSINALKNVNYTEKSKKTGIIYWQWNFMKYNIFFYSLFMIFIISTIFNFNDKKYSYFLNSLVIITYIIGHYKPLLNETTGRIWCYYAASLPIIILVYLYIFK